MPLERAFWRGRTQRCRGVSITLRSLAVALCDHVVFEGRKVGSHFAWHILNALTLFLLLRAKRRAS